MRLSLIDSGHQAMVIAPNERLFTALVGANSVIISALEDEEPSRHSALLRAAWNTVAPDPPTQTRPIPKRRRADQRDTVVAGTRRLINRSRRQNLLHEFRTAAQSLGMQPAGGENERPFEDWFEDDIWITGTRQQQDAALAQWLQSHWAIAHFT